jgi:hypothetical protein
MWSDDLHLMITGTIGSIAAQRHDQEKKRQVINLALTFAMTGSVCIPGKGVLRKWSKARKELKTLLFKAD